jgi:beta-lactam-binding protein with PASTA domain
VPNVVGQSRENGEAALRNAGFEVVVEETETPDPLQENLVLDQNPAGDTPAEPGSTVTIVVGRFLEPPADEATD